MESLFQKKPEASELLQKVGSKINPLPPLTHEQELRRSLLNSRLWQRGFRQRYYDLFKSIFSAYFIPETVLIIGFTFMIMVGLYINGTFLPPSAIKTNQNHTPFLETMEEQGIIKFSHLKEDGSRVYTLEFTSSSGSIEVFDPIDKSNIILISK